MSEIREWLEKGAPYAAGVALYETYGKSRVVLKSLRYGETEFTRATLRRELEKLLGPGLVEKVVSSPQKVARSPEKVANSPAPGSQLDEQRRGWYATRTYAHAQLELAATDEQRRQLAETILGVSAQLTASYQAVPGEVTPAPRPDLAAVTDAGEVRRLLANLRPLRSKLKKRPDRAADLARVQADIDTLETILKSL